METDFESLLPFLSALKRQTDALEDDDDSDPQSGASMGTQAQPQAGAPAVQTKGNALLQLLQSGLTSSAQGPGGAMQSGDPNQTPAASGAQNGAAGGQDPVSPAGPQVDLGQARQQTQNKQTQNQPTQPLLGQLRGVSPSPLPDELFENLADPPTLAVPTLSITTVAGGPGSGQPIWNTRFGLDIPADGKAGGCIIQKVIPSSTVEKTYWEAWPVNEGKQYTDFAEKNAGPADDYWSRPGRTAEATFYDKCARKDLERMGFEVGNVPEAGTRPSTYSDPSSYLLRNFDRVSKTVSRSFPY